MQQLACEVIGLVKRFFVVVTSLSSTWRLKIRLNKPFMPVYFQLQCGDQDDELKWPVTFAVTIRLMNQLCDHNHHEDSYRFQFNEKTTETHYSDQMRFIRYKQILTPTIGIQFLKDDSLKFCLWMHVV